MLAAVALNDVGETNFDLQPTYSRSQVLNTHSWPSLGLSLAAGSRTGLISANKIHHPSLGRPFQEEYSIPNMSIN